MEITYTMIGADGQQYGPVGLEQLKGWIREGRVTATTQVLRNDVNSWLAAVQYTELGLPQPGAAGTPPAFSQANANAVVANAALERRAKSGAGWFFLIGALSFVNSAIALSGSNVRFLVGLGVTDVITVFSSSLGNAGMAVGVALDLLVLGIFVVFGIFARKRHSWSFIAGMVCYAIDGGLLVLMGAQMINIAFHGLALVFMFLGLQANMKLNAMRRGMVA